MNKKFFIGLLIISLIFFAGGCGGSSNNFAVDITDINTALSGAWTAQTNGTATITSTNNEDSNELEEFIKAFGEIPSDILQQYNNQAKKANSVNAPVTRAMALFEDCSVEESSGTLKFTAIIILSNDTIYLPILFNGVQLSTQGNGTDSWTAATPDGGTLSINMTSDGKINLSGRINYLNYDCEFNTVINKNPSNLIDPETILDGAWVLDGTQGGGYLVRDSKITAAVAPEAASISFNNVANMSAFHVLSVNSSGNVNEESTLLQKINPSVEVTLSQICDDVYRIRDTSGNESIIFIDDTDKIFIIKNDSGNSVQTSTFLPLKKADFNIETALTKTWNAAPGEGGGYAHFDTSIFSADDEIDSEFLKLLEYLSFTLKNNASLNFSGVNLNDDGTITATININATFSFTNEFLEALGIIETLPIQESGQLTMTKSGNFLYFELDGDIYNLSFISDNELILSVQSAKTGEGESEFILRFRVK